MQRKSKSSMPTAESSYSHGTTNLSTVDEEPHSNGHAKSQKRTPFLFLALLVLLLYCSRTIYHFQYDMLPVPLDANQAGKRGFSEKLAIEHVKTLTKLGPHPIGSDALGLAMKMLYSFDFKFGILQESSCSFSRKFLLEASEKIKKEAHWEVDVQVDHFHAKSGANRLVSGLFKGRTLVYSDLEHVVLRILPKYLSEAEDNAILVSSHIDTVFSTEGAGDCTSCVAVMLELARGISHWAHGFKHAVIFLFNIGEEEGLNGAHSFITQHPWKSTIRFAIDLEAMGIGGKSSIFQSGIDPWAIESFAAVAKYPSGQIIAQDLFLSGAIKSATDFQIYSEVAGLPGLDFAYSDASAVYHTKNDKLKLLKPGSLQHLGENILAFLLHAATSAHIPKAKTGDAKDIVQNRVVFFDILGMYMVVYRQNLANMLHNSVILQSLLIWIASLVVGGTPAAISLCLSCLSIILMWLFSLGLSILVAFILPLICSSPVPYIASPWLVVGLFGAPAVLGATIGQHLGYLILQKYLWQVSFKRMLKQSLGIQADLIKWEAQRCLFKAGFVQWFVLLILGNFYKVGSSYIAIAWLVSPAFAYGLIEATLSPVRAPRQLKTITLLLGLTVPVLISAGSFIRLAETLTGIMVRFERNPGGMPKWLGSAIIAIYVSSIVCLTLVYLLSYVHHSGAKKWVILASSALFGLTLAIILVGIVPPFTDDVARAVNVVHVVDKTGISTENNNPISYVSLSSTTPGKFMKELDGLKDEGFACGKEKILDLVTFTVHYGCLSSNDTRGGWSESDIPTLQVERDLEIDVRVTLVSIDAKTSTRWSLAINTEEIEDFKLEGNSEELVPVGNKTTVDGWHIIQFSGGKNSLTQFGLTLFWHKNRTHSSPKTNMSGKEDSDILLKLRTDINRVTPKIARVLDKLPSWCSLFGKSTSPYTLAFLTNLQVDF